jgi:hypothetical protein
MLKYTSMLTQLTPSITFLGETLPIPQDCAQASECAAGALGTELTARTQAVVGGVELGALTESLRAIACGSCLGCIGTRAEVVLAQTFQTPSA